MCDRAAMNLSQFPLSQFQCAFLVGGVGVSKGKRKWRNSNHSLQTPAKGSKDSGQSPFKVSNSKRKAKPLSGCAPYGISRNNFRRAPNGQAARLFAR